MGLLLDDILKSIHNAVIEAQKISEQQHMRALGRYFYLNKNKEKMDEEEIKVEDIGMPKCIDLKLPFVEGDKVNYNVVEIPLIALNPPSSMKIKNMKVSFEAKLTGVDEPKKSLGFFKYFKGHEKQPDDKAYTNQAIKLDLSGTNSGGTAKIEIEFENSDSPETFARINDHIVKSFSF